MSVARSSRRHASAGFTVVEALLATVLMGGVLIVLSTVTAQWLPNWNRGFVRVQRTEHVALGLERLVADLSAAQFIPINRDNPQPLFEGTETSVIVVRSAIGPNARPGLEFVRIAEEPSASGPVLVRMRAAYVPITVSRAIGQVSFSDPVALIRTPYRVSFAFAGEDRQWRATWANATTLPRAVRLMLADRVTGRPPLFATIVSIHSELPATCNLAKSAQECFENRGSAASAAVADASPSAPPARGGPGQ